MQLRNRTIVRVEPPPKRQRRQSTSTSPDARHVTFVEHVDFFSPKPRRVVEVAEPAAAVVEVAEPAAAVVEVAEPAAAVVEVAEPAAAVVEVAEPATSTMVIEPAVDTPRKRVEEGELVSPPNRSLGGECTDYPVDQTTSNPTADELIRTDCADATLWKRYPSDDEERPVRNLLPSLSDSMKQVINAKAEQLLPKDTLQFIESIWEESLSTVTPEEIQAFMEHVTSRCTMYGDKMNIPCAHNYAVVVLYILPMLDAFSKSSFPMHPKYSPTIYCYSWTHPLVAQLARIHNNPDNVQFRVSVQTWQDEINKLYSKINARTWSGTSAK